jgi:hypothetical protein
MEELNDQIAANKSNVAYFKIIRSNNPIER